MTKEQLSALPVLRREITREKRRIAKLESAAIPADPAAQAALADARAAHEACLTRMLRAEAEAVGYIEKVEDASVRELLMLRYVDGIRSWQRIAFMVGEHDESYVRRKHNAYIKKHPE